jgi:hypothetical protein
MLYNGIKAGRQGDDCAFAARADEIPAIRAEIATTGIQAFNPAGTSVDSRFRYSLSDSLEGSSGQQARLMAKFRRLLSQTDENDRKLLLHMARKMADHKSA